MKGAFWIWYPGDFEIYHGLKQNFSREERGFDWPAYWYMDDCRKNIKFSRNYLLEKETEFTAYSHAQGYLLVNGKKHHFSENIRCESGKTEIVIFAGMVTGVPAVYIEGEAIFSDSEWFVEDYVSEPVKVGYGSRYNCKEQNPSEWEYDSVMVQPVNVSETADGVLYDFGRELTAELEISFLDSFRPIMVCYGESEAEALDIERCYCSQRILKENDALRRRAFRYIFIPQCNSAEIIVKAKHIFVDIPVKASFACNDHEINRIWEISAETFKLCSGIFFIDGVKRDRWIWSGDAYQSYMINQYFMFDEEINKRTIWALRGNDPVRQHINTIVDYSMYWIISIYNHYHMTGDLEFVKMIYPKMKSMMEFLECQLDEKGFIIGRTGDWIFIDWAENIDKSGPICAEQILLSRCYHTMWVLEEFLDKPSDNYKRKYLDLKMRIEKYFWCEHKGAYIDSYLSGRENVSRHSNLFAVLFEQADNEKKEMIYKNVICNEKIPEITTPYFKFYELDALCKFGKRKEVLERMRAYWGGMIKEGAGTVWEEYSPEHSGNQHYAMYDDPYGKSLCHAWGAAPIYLLGKYFMGVEATAPGYSSFRVSPDTDAFAEFEGTVPVKGGKVSIKWDGKELKVWTDRCGGELLYKGERYELEINEEMRLFRH